MRRTALLVGGSGPTGPIVADGLAARGYQVTLLHRGTHESPEVARYEHIHADPHFRETLDDALDGRSFDVVVATYGRLRHVADAVVDRCGQFVAVSGLPVYAGYHCPGRRVPRGIAVGATEDTADDGRPDEADETPGETFARKIRETERHVLDRHAENAFSASVFRYPSIYGPRQLFPREWSVIRRVLDGRRHIILADGGLTISARCAARNAAAHLLAAVDRPDAAAGEVFNVADRDQFSLRQWVELLATAAGGSLEVVSLPFALAGPGRALFPIGHTDHVLVNAGKVSERLGYVEAVPAGAALAETVQWYLANPPDEHQSAALTDAFDYVAEDELIETFRALTGQLAAGQPELVAAHPYAHPRLAGARDHRNR